MKRLLMAISLGCAFSSVATDLDMANKIRAEGFYNSHVMNTLQHLTDQIGPRLTGSPQMNEANRWTMERLQQWGLKNAHLDPFEFGRGWSHDSISVAMVAPRKVSLHGIPMAWTPGTKGDVTGDVVYFDAATIGELVQYKDQLKGKILLMSVSKEIGEPKNNIFQRHDSKSLAKLDEFEIGRYASHQKSSNAATRDVRMQRYRFAQALNRFLTEQQVAAVVYRSRRQGGIVDARGKNHRIGETFSVPAVVIEAEHYQLLLRSLDNDQTPRLTLNVDATFHDKDIKAYNTIAEIPGTDPDPEIVMVGGHLDSWHGSGGAVDNAAGVSVSMEAVRILSAIGVKPKRTIRVALWSGEEQGLYGSRSYVEKNFATRPKPKTEQERKLPRHLWKSVGWPIEPKAGYDKFSVYFNMDGGSGRFRGIHTEGNVAVKPIFASWFRPYSDLSPGKVVNKQDNHTDHEAFDDVGLPGFQFIQDKLDYFSRLHHTHLDSYDHVIEDDLKQASVIMAAFIYNAAMADERLPRKPMPTKPSLLQQQKIEKKVKQIRRKRQRDGNKAVATTPYID